MAWEPPVGEGTRAPPPPPPPPPTSGTASRDGRRWKTSQVIVAAAVALLVGIGIGAAASSGKKDDTASVANTTSTSTDTNVTSPEATITSPTEPPTTLPPAPAEFKIGEKITYDKGASVQVFSYEQPVTGGEFDTPDAGTVYALIDVQVCAGSDTVSYNTLGFAAQMADNRRWENVFGNVRSPDLGSGDLPAGQCKRGFVTLESTAGQRPVYVVWDYSGWEQGRWKV